MIVVRRLNGGIFILNAELIESVERCPDTLVTLTSGKKYFVLNTPEEITEKVLEYRRCLATKSPEQPCPEPCVPDVTPIDD
jgi:flagellar protein FlbD